MYSLGVRNALLAALGLILLSILIPGLCAAADYKVVTTEALKEMMDSQKQFTLIDAMTKEEYDEAHIVDAINIPENKFDSLVLKLPADKNASWLFTAMA